MKYQITKVILSLTAGLAVLSLSEEPWTVKTYVAAIVAAITGWLSPSSFNIKRKQ
jgi:hypothetical protein